MASLADATNASAKFTAGPLRAACEEPEGGGTLKMGAALPLAADGLVADEDGAGTLKVGGVLLLLTGGLEADANVDVNDACG